MEILYGIFALLFYSYFLVFIGMGIVQPIAAVIRIIQAKRKDGPYVIGLKRYLIAVIVYLIIFFNLVGHPIPNFGFWLLYAHIIPWIFAIWYISHIRFWKKKMNNIIAYDRELLLNKPNEDRLLLDSYPKKKVQLNKPIKLNLETKERPPAIIRSLPILNKAN